MVHTQGHNNLVILSNHDWNFTRHGLMLHSLVTDCYLHFYKNPYVYLKTQNHPHMCVSFYAGCSVLIINLYFFISHNSQTSWVLSLAFLHLMWASRFSFFKIVNSRVHLILDSVGSASWKQTITVNDLINTHSQKNTLYLINAPAPFRCKVCITCPLPL